LRAAFLKLSEIRIIPIEGLPEIHAGDDLASLIHSCVPPPGLQNRDVIVVAHKIVSKAEGRVVAARDRRRVAAQESTRILRRSGDMIISETRHGFVCANAGVDASNVPGDQVVLLPIDPDLSARRLRARLEHLSDVSLGIVISDTFGRAWRLGQTNVAIGVAGMEPFVDYRGATDATGKDLVATRICIVDEIAGAAELVTGKSLQVPAAVVRGAPFSPGRGSATEIVRPPEEDLFR
jgi:coenzyme F420-0:L-glutamate ligase / coenzyme F420-1:gamma-L-glutamate ligase